MIEKIEFFNYPLKELKNILHKINLINTLSNPYVFIEIQNVPFICKKRYISETTIILKENIIEINYVKKDRLVALIILIIEKTSNDEITKIIINDIEIKNDILIQDYLNITDCDMSKIEIFFENEEDAKLSTCYIYYLVTPQKHDSFFFLKEYNRIKQEKKK